MIQRSVGAQVPLAPYDDLPKMARWQVIVIGAGAGGILAAARAAERGRRVLLLEKNRKAGVKILMSGGTRCNLTHACDKWGIIEAYGKQGKFLHSALAALGPADLVRLIEDEGVPTKVEETGKVFPVSNRAADVLAGLLERLKRSGAAIHLGEPALDIDLLPDGFSVSTPLGGHAAERLIVTTGGQSYPGCGTTGDGYAWAEKTGHTLVTPRPALVPLVCEAAWLRELSGVTLSDTELSVVAENETGDAPTRRRGSLLFTHQGISGPVALDVSRAFTAPGGGRLSLVCDFFPELKEEALEAELREACGVQGKRQLAAIAAAWIPRRLAEALLSLCGIPLDRRAAETSRPERQRLVQAIKETRLAVDGTLGFKKAEVTAGGVHLAEIDSRTMQSRLVPGLFFAGEILDLDGPIGGYNFQAAFSTGWLAGQSA